MTDYTSKERQNKRREKLNNVAVKLGFESWSAYETHMLEMEPAGMFQEYQCPCGHSDYLPHERTKFAKLY